MQIIIIEVKLIDSNNNLIMILRDYAYINYSIIIVYSYISFFFKVAR